MATKEFNERDASFIELCRSLAFVLNSFTCAFRLLVVACHFTTFLHT
jgi:hypothetical protein